MSPSNEGEPEAVAGDTYISIQRLGATSGNNVWEQRLDTTSGNNIWEQHLVDNILSDDEDYIRPVHRLFGNYRHVQAEVNHLVQRSYEKPFKWYYLTFAPFNKNYEKDIKFYLNDGFRHATKKIGKVECFIITREINAKKVHLNVLCCSDQSLEKLHQMKTNKYSIHCQELPGPRDRRLVLEYILKESKSRYFHEHLDYQYSKK